MPKLSWRARATRAVARLMRSRIEDGAYQPGGPLPPVAQMAATLGVSRRAIASAVHELVRSGHLETRPYHGHYVRPRKHWRTP